MAKTIEEKPALFIGCGLLIGSRPKLVYYGGRILIPSLNGQTAAASQEWFETLAEQEAIRLCEREGCTPLPGAPVELFWYWDADSGDVMLIWRQPMLDARQHH